MVLRHERPATFITVVSEPFDPRTAVRTASFHFTEENRVLFQAISDKLDKMIQICDRYGHTRERYEQNINSPISESKRSVGRVANEVDLFRNESRNAGNVMEEEDLYICQLFDEMPHRQIETCGKISEVRKNELDEDSFGIYILFDKTSDLDEDSLNVYHLFDETPLNQIEACCEDRGIFYELEADSYGIYNLFDEMPQREIRKYDEVYEVFQLFDEMPHNEIKKYDEVYEVYQLFDEISQSKIRNYEEVYETYHLFEEVPLNEFKRYGNDYEVGSGSLVTDQLLEERLKRKTKNHDRKLELLRLPPEPPPDYYSMVKNDNNSGIVEQPIFDGWILIQQDAKRRSEELKKGEAGLMRQIITQDKYVYNLNHIVQNPLGMDGLQIMLALGVNEVCLEQMMLKLNERHDGRSFISTIHLIGFAVETRDHPLSFHAYNFDQEIRKSFRQFFSYHFVKALGSIMINVASSECIRFEEMFFQNLEEKGVCVALYNYEILLLLNYHHYLGDAIVGGETLVKACKPAIEFSYLKIVIHNSKQDSEAVPPLQVGGHNLTDGIVISRRAFDIDGCIEMGQNTCICKNRKTPTVMLSFKIEDGRLNDVGIITYGRLLMVTISKGTGPETLRYIDLVQSEFTLQTSKAFNAAETRAVLIAFIELEKKARCILTGSFFVDMEVGEQVDGATGSLTWSRNRKYSKNNEDLQMRGYFMYDCMDLWQQFLTTLMDYLLVLLMNYSGEYILKYSNNVGSSIFYLHRRSVVVTNVKHWKKVMVLLSLIFDCKHKDQTNNSSHTLGDKTYQNSAATFCRIKSYGVYSDFDHSVDGLIHEGSVLGIFVPYIALWGLGFATLAAFGSLLDGGYHITIEVRYKFLSRFWDTLNLHRALLWVVRQFGLEIVKFDWKYARIREELLCRNGEIKSISIQGHNLWKLHIDHVQSLYVVMQLLSNEELMSGSTEYVKTTSVARLLKKEDLYDLRLEVKPI